jgi:hypothetical protein
MPVRILGHAEILQEISDVLAKHISTGAVDNLVLQLQP